MMKDLSYGMLSAVSEGIKIRYQYEQGKSGWKLMIWFGDLVYISLPEETILDNKDILRSMMNQIEDILGERKSP